MEIMCWNRRQPLRLIKAKTTLENSLIVVGIIVVITGSICIVHMVIKQETTLSTSIWRSPIAIDTYQCWNCYKAIKDHTYIDSFILDSSNIIETQQTRANWTSCSFQAPLTRRFTAGHAGPSEPRLACHHLPRMLPGLPVAFFSSLPRYSHHALLFPSTHGAPCQSARRLVLEAGHSAMLISARGWVSQGSPPGNGCTASPSWRISYTLAFPHRWWLCRNLHDNETASILYHVKVRQEYSG